jgi:hypothetical protein
MWRDKLENRLEGKRRISQGQPAIERGERT